MIKVILYYILVESLGVVESLILVFVLMIYVFILVDIWVKEGIMDGFVRIFVGIEDIEDLVDDLK